jgi:outer membrane protein assembly factor BamB
MIKIVLGLCFILSSCATINSNIAKVGLEKPQKDTDHFRVSWIKNLDPVYNTGNLPIGTSSPFVFEDMLFMGDLNGIMTAYDVDNGKVLWSFDDGSPLQGQVNKVGENIFYGSKTGRLFSRKYVDGALNYAIDLGSPIESQPSYINGRLVVHLRNHTVVTLDAATGKVFWRYKRSIPFVTTLQRVSQIMPFKNSMIIGFADGYLVSLSLEEGVIKWEQKLSTGLKFVDVDVKPVYFNNLIVAGSASGPMRMINPENGVIERTIEIFQSHTPLLVGNDLVVGSVFGILYRVDKSGKIKHQRKISDDGISSVVSWKNGLAVTTMGETIHQLNNDSFKELATFNLGSDQSAVFGTSVLGDDILSVYSSRNRLYVFK